jgi:hypothetical protein
MAWRFGDLGGVTVLAAIGDPVSEAEWLKRPKLRGARCGARARGIRVLENNVVEVSKRIADGFVCADGGLEEKDFWLFAHEGAHRTKSEAAARKVPRASQ